LLQKGPLSSLHRARPSGATAAVILSRRPVLMLPFDEVVALVAWRTIWHGTLIRYRKYQLGPIRRAGPWRSCEKRTPGLVEGRRLAAR
jgi:hypothetical protein